MSQIHTPVLPTRRVRGLSPTPFLWWVDVLIFGILIAIAYGIVVAASRWIGPFTPARQIDLSPRALPLYAGLSTLRMALAYILSLAFSLVYARIAAAHHRAERVMIPLLDILQSVPILSFLPGVVLGLVALFPHSNIGLELAAVLLIFTSQAWNMAFSFYHSLLVVPKDLREAATIYQLNGWRRFIHLELPFGMIPLIWNSMMSWAGGWFFLMAAEQFTLGNQSFQMPGLGSYLQTAANVGDISALLLGLVTLVVVIALLDTFLWRPLIAWADRFKIEQTTSGQPPTSFVLRSLRRSALLAWLTARVFNPGFERLDHLLGRLLPAPGQSPMRMSLGSTQQEVIVDEKATGRAWPAQIGRIALLAVGVLFAVLCLWGALAGLRLLAQVSPQEWGLVSLSALATLARTTLALLIGVAWTVPAGVAIGLNPRLAQRAQPFVQMVASIPATALFPALLLVILELPGGLNLAAIVLMLLGTQWYVLFNVIAGAMAIPNDLRDAGAIYKVRGWQRWRTLILPAIFPYLVTGMITATGGAWNASVIAEYVSFNGQTHSVLGLGALIAESAASRHFALLLAATLAMALVVIAINRFVWRRLYRLAEQRFHLD